MLISCVQVFGCLEGANFILLGAIRSILCLYLPFLVCVKAKVENTRVNKNCLINYLVFNLKLVFHNVRKTLNDFFLLNRTRSSYSADTSFSFSFLKGDRYKKIESTNLKARRYFSCNENYASIILQKQTTRVQILIELFRITVHQAKTSCYNLGFRVVKQTRFVFFLYIC